MFRIIFEVKIAIGVSEEVWKAIDNTKLDAITDACCEVTDGLDLQAQYTNALVLKKLPCPVTVRVEA